MRRLRGASWWCLGVVLLTGHVQGVDPVSVIWPDSVNGSQVQTAAPSLVVQLGYTQAVSSVAVSPDGTLAVAGSFFGTTRLWHLPTGSELRRFDGHTAGVIAAVFSPDGRQVLTGSHDGSARLWDASTGAEVLLFEDESGALPSSVAFSADGRVLLVGAMGGPARLFDRETGEELLSVQPDVAGAPHAALSPDATRIVTAGVAPGIQIWDAGTGELQTSFASEVPVVSGALAFSRDGAVVISGHADGAVHIWDPEAGEVTRTLQGHSGGASGLSLSSDGSLLLTTSNTDG